MTVYLSTKHATAKPSSKETVILVDPLSTGFMLQQRCFDAGYDVMIVWSDQSSPAARAKHLQNTGRTDDDFAAIIVGANIKALLCGSNFGVLLEDELANNLKVFYSIVDITSTFKVCAEGEEMIVALPPTTVTPDRLSNIPHIRSSGVNNIAIKCDKYMQYTTAKAAGIPVARQMLAKSEEDVFAFLKEYSSDENFKVVLKPQKGAGSVGVTFCDSPMAVWTAFDTIMGGSYCDHCTAYKHYNNDGVLIQEFMEGTEYIVNLVCNEGVRKCTAMWKYDKRPYNGGSFVCFGKSLLSMEEDQRHREILDYTLSVLEAFCFMNGAIHAEVMYIEGRGPLLVEINCRLQGGNAAWVPPVEACMGYSQLSVLMDVYLNEGKILFDNIPSAPESILGGCYAVKMRSNVCGILQDIIQSQLNRILALPSYQGHFFLVKPSDKLLLTVDMPSVPGEVTLVNEDRDILDQDYALLNEILDEGIFVAIPEGSPDEALVMSMINTDPIPVIMADAADTVPSAVDISNLTSDDISLS
eukprot:scaffold82841_cov63-Cyclotella_meneghiniana.AAC.10